MALPITALYAGLLGLLLLVLSFRVVLVRRARGVSLGSGGDAELEQRIRTHANFIEYVPMLLVLLGLLEANGLPGWAVHALGSALLAARLAHPLGMAGHGMAWRVLGASLTFTTLMVAAAALLGLALAS